MFNIHHFLDAASMSIFGMFALWAAGSKWHWFVRTAVAAGALLFLLLLPAYELVIQFGLQMLIVVAGMTLWRWRVGRRLPTNRTTTATRRAQLSLQSLLLLTVVVAVATPVLARTARLGAWQWSNSITNGCHSGFVTLLCAWFVLGRKPLRTRILLFVPLWAAMLLFLAITTAGRDAFLSWYRSGVPWQQMMSAPLQGYVRRWGVLLGMSVPMICGWLLLMVRAGWYHTIHGADSTTASIPASASRQRTARIALVAWTLAILAIPVYLYLQLISPLPPLDRSPQHAAGYADLIVAGKMIGNADANGLMHRQQLTADQLHERIDAQSDAFERMRKAFIDPSPPQETYTPDENEAVRHLAWALDAKLDLAERLPSPQMAAETNLDWLQMLSVLRREGEFSQYFQMEDLEESITKSIWQSRLALSAGQLRALVAAMQTQESQIPPWPTIKERLRLERAAASWRSHMQLILEDWSGVDRFAAQRKEHARARARFRLLMVELAIDAFQDDHGRPPHDLAELVPDYLAAIPDDPYGAGPLRYRTNGELHVLYSIGADGDDDSSPLDSVVGRGEGDLTAEFLLR